MPRTLTFRDFAWRSKHFLPGKAGSATHPHWHAYRARFWFVGPVDQDDLVEKLEQVFGCLHGSSLNTHVQPDSSDETVALWLLGEAKRRIGDCVRVALENDGQRGAEAEA